ncbi:MAG TPA: hypothetical protein VM581_02855 [Magnetospirillaceae bacterium]|nr:hypothetical protein [Magnetospirillaceae bacterium]
MAVASVWAGAVVFIVITLGGFGIWRLEVFMRDRHKLPSRTKAKAAIAERFVDLAIREATKREEVELRQLELRRKIAEEQGLLERVSELADAHLEVEKARLEVLAESEAWRGNHAAMRDRADQLVEAYHKYLRGCQYITSNYLGLPQFIELMDQQE